MSNFNAPFERGKTWYGGRTIDVSSSYANVGGVHLEGQVHDFDEYNSTVQTGVAVGAIVVPSGFNIGAQQSNLRKTTCICVRNCSGFTLLPGKLVVYGTAANKFKRIAGHAAVTAEEVAGVVDDKLPAAGVPDGDLFWLVTDGLALVNTPLTNALFPQDVTAGAPLYASTAANSTATTLGGRWRTLPASFAAAETTDNAANTQPVWKFMLNSFGRAVSACTTNGTGGVTLCSNILVHVKTLGQK